MSALILKNQVLLDMYILTVYFLDSCSWIVFLKKQMRTLAANHLLKTNCPTFCFYRFDRRLKRSKMRPIRMLNHWHSWFLKTLQVLNMSHICTFNIGHPMLLSDKTFSLLPQLLRTQDRAFNVYLSNLIELLFTTKLDWWHFCIKLLRLRQTSVLLEQMHNF